MTERQAKFWRALVAPFPSAAYKTRQGAGGKTFTYLDSRTIMNRLDDVAGPGGWSLEFHEGTRGMICRLILTVPDGSDTGFVKVAKDGGGGFRAMQDDDSTFKTGFTSAIKTAAAAFGIGRELYGDGMPAYCADLHNTQATGTPQSGPGAGAPPVQKSPSNGNGNNGGGRYDDSGPGKPPFGRPGKAPYAWSRKTGEFYGVDVLGRMTAYAKKRGKPERTDQWDEGFLDECLAKTLGWIKTLDNYGGEFGSPLSDDNEEAMGSSGRTGATASHASPVSAVANPNGNVISAIVAAVNALLNKKTGRAPKPEEVVAAIGEIASSVPNGHGTRGEVLQSLRGCQDAVWLKNILNQTNRQIEEAARMDADMAVVGVDDDIPF